MSPILQYPRVLYASGGRTMIVKNATEYEAQGPEWHIAPEGVWSGAHVIRRETIDNAYFWPIKAPIVCNFWSIRPDADCLIRSNVLSDDSEDTLAANAQEICIAGPVFGPPRYQIGTSVIYIKAVGPGPVVVHSRFML